MANSRGTFIIAKKNAKKKLSEASFADYKLRCKLNNNNNDNQHHHRHQQSQQTTTTTTNSSNNVYNIVAVSTCLDHINYPAVLDSTIESHQNIPKNHHLIYSIRTTIPSSITCLTAAQAVDQNSNKKIASEGIDITPIVESLYGFANRLHPVTPTGAHNQLNMPQVYQTRTSFVGNTIIRPASATGKRGGRRPKEYEEYDHVTLSEEERDKRDKRRLRNKEAAARCRQRRLDLMGSLQNQVNQLKEENKMKDAKIAELQLLKNELIAVIRDHHCVLPEALRQTLDVDMSSTQQYMPRGAPATVVTVPTSTEIVSYTSSEPSPQSLLSSRKRPASAMIPDLRQSPPPCASSLTTNVTLNRSNNQTNILTLTKPSSMQIKQEPTLFDVNGHDLPHEEIKRPTSLAFTDGVTTTTAYSSLSSSGVPITTPSNLIATSDFGGVNLLDGPTGLTPCHPPQATAFQLPSMAAPLGDGRSFETL